MVDQYDDGFLDEYQGVGTEDLTGGTPYLSVVNKLTEEGMAQGKFLGSWWHSGLGKAFKSPIEVVPIGWKPVWVEKSTEGRTVGYYREKEIELQETGTGSTYKCVNPATGNRVEKTFCIVLTLPQEQNASALYIPSATSGEAARLWRKMLNFNRLSSGAKAPIFSHVWKLSTAKRTNGNNVFYVLDSVEKGQQITKEYLLAEIHPVLALVDGNPHNLLPNTGAASVKEVDENDEILA